MLERGGNAVDAAIACAFMQGVVDPPMSGIGGFSSMQLYMPSRGVHQIVEFYAKASLSATPEMWADKLIGQSHDGFAFLLEGGNCEFGHLAACTPGSINGYDFALSRYGTMDWADIIAPAIRQAREGVLVRPHMHWLFYHGELAEEIAADFAAHGGLSRVKTLRPTSFPSPSRSGAPIGANASRPAPPASGMLMLQILNKLENFDAGALTHGGTAHVALPAEAMKRMTIDKDLHMGDPAYVDVPVDRLISKAHAAAQAASIRRGERADVKRLERSFSRETTHVSVVDRHGNAVALTHTLGSPSGAITEGLGFIYNGTMSRFDPRPGRAGSIAPGKRRSSSAAPTIFFKDDTPFIVMGAPGDSYIAPAMAQGISNVVDFGMGMLEAVAAPRIMAVSNSIDISNRIRRSVGEELVAIGYDVKRSAQSYPFAALHGILIEDGPCSGGANPQRDGMAIPVPA